MSSLSRGDPKTRIAYQIVDGDCREAFEFYRSVFGGRDRIRAKEFGHSVRAMPYYSPILNRLRHFAKSTADLARICRGQNRELAWSWSRLHFRRERIRDKHQLQSPMQAQISRARHGPPDQLSPSALEISVL